MDIKAKITELETKIKNDPKLLENFKNDPVKTLEGILGVDLPDDQIKQVAETLKAKINISDAAGKLGGIGEKLGGLLNK